MVSADCNRYLTVKKPASDLVDLEFVLSHYIATDSPGRYRYSGIDWVIDIDGSCNVDSLSKGERVSVISLDVGLLRVVRAA